nr:MAG TPA: hypothetical protein [Caudoviricetes sp.]
MSRLSIGYIRYCDLSVCLYNSSPSIKKENAIFAFS